jgi:hypothetical protein
MYVGGVSHARFARFFLFPTDIGHLFPDTSGWGRSRALVMGGHHETEVATKGN